MSVLGQRICTAVVLLLVLGSILFYMSPQWAAYAISIFVLVGVWEWSGFFGRPAWWVRSIYVIAVGALAVASYPWIVAIDGRFFLLAVQLFWVLVLLRLVFSPLRFPAWQTALAGLGCLLPAWFALLVMLHSAEGVWRLLWLIAIVAAADTGAYFTGRAFGRHKLAPAISPGKTLEGMLGGLALAAAAGAAGGWLAGFNPWLFAPAGAAVGMISVLGDLTVSAFKRNAGLKDSGWVLPGHGGVLDRIDSLLSALPLFLLLLLWLEAV